MKLLNLTPHEVVIIRNGVSTVFKPEEIPARCSSTTSVVGELHVDGTTVDLTCTSFGEVQGLPSPKEGVGYIVSRLVAEACPQRHDLFITNGAVRDNSGRVIGCTSLTQIH